MICLEVTGEDDLTIPLRGYMTVGDEVRGYSALLLLKTHPLDVRYRSRSRDLQSPRSVFSTFPILPTRLSGSWKPALYGSPAGAFEPLEDIDSERQASVRRMTGLFPGMSRKFCDK